MQDYFLHKELHRCVQTCQPQNYWSGEACESCSEGENGVKRCTRCQEFTGKCTQCEDGFTLNESSNSCDKTCEADEFYTGLDQDSCQKCSSLPENRECQTCTRLTGTCLTCKKGYWLTLAPENKCVNTCSSPAHYLRILQNERAECTQCSLVEGNTKCSECEDFTGKCTKCSQGYHFDEESKFCRKTCGTNEFWTGKTLNTCSPCSSVKYNEGCATCSDITAECKSSLPGYEYILPTKYSKKICQPNEYWTGKEQNTCLKCNSVQANGGCLKCEDKTSICTTCENGFEFESKWSEFCRPICAEGEYWEGKPSKKCIPCSQNNPGCEKCRGERGICTSCGEGYKFAAYSRTCRPICNQGEYWIGESDNRCELCSVTKPNCLSCLDETAECVFCQDGYGFTSNSDDFCRARCKRNQFWTGKTTNTCEDCSSQVSNCQKCSDESAICSKCERGFKLTQTDSKGFCRRTCNSESGEYWSGASENVCLQCSNIDQNCARCSDETGVCQKCQDEYHLNQDGLCQKDCEENQFWKGPSDNTCSSCSTDKNQFCAACTNITGECTQCQSENYWLNEEESSFCQKKCPSPAGYYWNQTLNDCLACSENCAACQNVTSHCLACKDTYELSEETHKCYEVLPIDVPVMKGAYFDELEPAIVMFFDRTVTEKTIPSRMRKLDLSLIQFKSRKQIRLTKKGFYINIQEDSLQKNYHRPGVQETAMEALTKDEGEILSARFLKIKDDVYERNKRTLKFDLDVDELNNVGLLVESEIMRLLKEGPKKSGNKKRDRVLESPQKDPEVVRYGRSSRSFNTKMSLSKDTEVPTFSMMIENVSFFKSPSESTFEMIGLVASTTLKISAYLALPFSIPSFVSLIHAEQLVNTFRLIHTGYAANTEVFIKHSDSNALTLLGPIEFMAAEISKCNISPLFVKRGLTCVAVNSRSMPIIFLILMILLLKLVVFVYSSAKKFRKGKKDKKDAQGLERNSETGSSTSKTRFLGCQWNFEKMKKIGEKAKGIFSVFLRLRTIFYLMLAAQMDILLQSFLSIKNLDFQSSAGMVSFVLASCCLLLYIWMFSVVVREYLVSKKPYKNHGRKSKREQSKPNQVNKTRTFLILDNYKNEATKNGIALKTEIQMINMNLILPLVVVFGVEHPVVQLSSMILIFSILILWLIAKKPFRGYFQLAQVSKIGCLLVISAITIASLPEINISMTEKVRHNSDGYLLILIVSLLFLAQLVFAAIACIEPAFVKYKKSLEKKNKEVRKSSKKKKAEISFEFDRDEEKSFRYQNLQSTRR